MPSSKLSEFKLSLSLGYNQGIRSVSRNNKPENILLLDGERDVLTVLKQNNINVKPFCS